MQCCPQALAQSAPSPNSSPVGAAAGATTSHGVGAGSAAASTAASMPAHPIAPINLDLSSTSASLSAPQRLGNQTVTIHAGTSTIGVTSQSVLTPAERVAVWQVLTSGSQSIQLGQQGNAVGGSLSVSSNISQNISSLVIPTGVTFLDTAAKLGVAGNLTNMGALNVVPTAGINAASISAASIFNGVGASIMSSTPLTITAVHDIVNNGQITSLASLTANAGGSIINQSIGATQALMSAQTLNLITGSGSIVNSGVLSAINALNVNTQTALQNLTINNTSGLMQVFNGSINLRQSGYAGAANISLMGGDWLSKQLNFSAGTGSVTADIGNVTGVINVDAGCAHILASTSNLQLGQLNISGDPTYYNTLGSISVTGPITTTAGQALAFVASQDISISNNITTNATSSNNGSLTLIAGANITAPPAVNTQVNGDTSTVLTITQGGGAAHGSATGGAINLTGAGNAIATNGGALTMVAFSGSGVGSALTPGSITVQQSISTNSATTGPNGSVLMISGASSGTGISTSGITTTGGTGSAPGSITISTATPNVSGGTTITNGFLAGGFTAGTTTAASIATGALTTNGTTSGGQAGGAVTLTSGGAITTGTITTYGGTGTNSSISDGTAGGNAGAVTINAAGNIQTGNIIAYGGSGGNFIAGAPATDYFGGAGGTGATIALTSTGAAVTSGFINSSGGATGTGGANNIPINSNSAGAQAGGSAGGITISAPGGINTGYLRAFGAGGEGGADGSGGLIASATSNGGAGNSIALTSSSGAVMVNGDINSSGGGGGGTGYDSNTPGLTAGNGGNSGNITINALGTVQVAGPVLAGGGGGGSGLNLGAYGNGGGASFGGGGAGADGGAGGGGLYGGGGSSNWGSPAGGSATQGGAAVNPQGYPVVTSGSAGQGGNAGDLSNGGTPARIGGTFGQGGEGSSGAGNVNLVAQYGVGDVGGAPGANGKITITGGSVNVTGTVATYYPGATGGSTGFTTSPYAGVSIFGGTPSQSTQITANAGSITVAGVVMTSGIDSTSVINTAYTLNGGNAGNIVITAPAGSVTLGGITATGGGGGSSGTVNGGAGGMGGNAQITAGQNFVLNGPVLLTGGTGGVSSLAGGVGGQGGTGGVLTIATNGMITINGALTTSGGNGGIDAAGTGGAGGLGGNFSLVNTAGAMLLTGNITTTGGSGGTGSAVANRGVGGNGGLITLKTIDTGAVYVVGNLDSSGGAGATAATIGQPGAITVSADDNYAGQGLASPDTPVGISGYVKAAAGLVGASLTSSRANLTASAGAVLLSGNDVAVFGTTFTNNGDAQGPFSVFGGSSVTIVSPGANLGLQQHYPSATNLGSTATFASGIVANGFDGFDAGAAFALGLSGSTGQIASRINGVNNTVTINTTFTPAAHNILDNAIQVVPGTSHILSYIDNAGSTHTVSGGNLTATQTIAIIQSQYVGSQTLSVDPTATPIATGGSFNIAAANFPAISDNGANFSTLVIPAGVTGNVTTSTLVPANGATTGPITIGGTLNFTNAAGGGINASSSISTTGTGVIASTQAGNVNLTVNSAGGAIGSIGTPIALSLSNVSLNASAAGGTVFANDKLASGDITIGNSSVNSSFQFASSVSSGNILTGASTITAGNVVLSSTNGGIGTNASNVRTNTALLTASAPNGSSFITDSARVTIQDNNGFTNSVAPGSGTFFLADTNAAGAGNTAIAFNPAATPISGESIVLSAPVSGDIGANGAKIITTASDITANAAGGSVYINGINPAGIDLQTDPVTGLTSSASVLFSLNATASMQVLSSMATNGGSIALTAGTNINGPAGAITLDTSGANGGAISITAGTTGPGGAGGLLDLTNVNLNTGGGGGALGTVNLTAVTGTTNTGNVVVGNISTSGAAGVSGGTGTAGKAASNITISGYNVTTGTDNANGGAGGASTTAGVAGGAGGNSAIITINATGGVTTAGLSASGGTGGLANNATGTGGLGGTGGSLAVAAAGVVSITGALSTAGGTGGAATLKGGNGNVGGNISITDVSNSVFITGNVTTSGGNGGAGSLAARQGNGANGGAVSLTTTNIGALSIIGNVVTSGGSAATLATIGQPGAVTIAADTNFAGQGQTGPNSAVGVNGYIQAAPGAVAGVPAIAANLNGTAGAIQLSGHNVAVFGPTLAVGATQYSVWGGSSITVTSPGTGLPQNYASASDLGSTNAVTNPITTKGFDAYHAGAGIFTFGASGSTGDFASRINGVANTVTINGSSPAAHNTLDTTQQQFNGGAAPLSYIDSAGTIHSITAASTVTAAELVALVQNQYSGGQTLVLNTAALPVATGGDFTITNVNFPSAGDNAAKFSVLSIPANVTAHVTTATLLPQSVNGALNSVAVAGTLSFENIAGGGISGTGTITTSGAGLITTTQAANVSLTTTSATGIGSIATPLAVNLANISANDANGSIYINDQLAAGNITVGNSAANAAAGTFQLSATASTGNILNTGFTIAGNAIVLTSTNGNVGTAAAPVAINGALLTSSTSNGSSFITDSARVTLQDKNGLTNNAALVTGTYYLADTNAAGAGTTAIAFAAGATPVGGEAIVLSASSSGDIGTAGTPIQTSAIDITANAANGSVYVNATNPAGIDLQTDPTTGLTSGSTVNFNLTASQGITTVNAFSAAKNVTLASVNDFVDLTGTLAAGISTNGGTFSASAGTNIIGPAGAATINTANAGTNGGAVSLTSGTAAAGGAINLPSVSILTGGGGGLFGNVTLTGTTGATNTGDVTIGAITTAGAAGTNGVTGTVGSAASNVTITGAAVTTGAVTMTGGVGGSSTGASGATGGASGTLQVTAAGSSSIASVSAVGGAGGASTQNVAGAHGGVGGQGGIVNLFDTTGTLTVGAVTANGGAGGADTIAGRTGGAGGTGGAVTISMNPATSGTISLTGAISAAGGTGGNATGGGGAIGGAGGAGGSGVNITNAFGPIIDAGGISTTGGSGGTGSSAANQGAGGSGAPLSVQTTNYGAITVVGNLNSSGGAGGAVVGQPGAITVKADSNFAGQGFTGPNSAVAIQGYVEGAAGSLAGAALSRAALTGAAGAIQLAGHNVSLFGTTLPVAGVNFSVFGGSSISITSPGSTIPQNYPSISNLGSTATLANAITASGFDAFDVGGTFNLGTSGSIGDIGSRVNGVVNTVIINSGSPAARNILDSSPQVFVGGSAPLTYIDSAGTLHGVTSASTITAAEWIALVQNQYATSQTLIVDTSATPIATGGSFNIANVNFPKVTDNGGNFSSLVIPASVTGTVSTATVLPANGAIAGAVQVAGTLSFTNAAGGGINAGTAITTSGAGLISTTQVANISLTVNSNNATIGSAVTPLAVSLPALTINANGTNSNAFVNDQLAAGNITVGTSGATNTFQLQATATSGAIVDAGTTITAGNVILASSNGDVGSVANNININSPFLTVSALNGSSYVTDSAKVTVQDNNGFANAVSTSSGTFFLADTNAAGAGTAAIAFSPTATPIAANSLVLSASTSGDIGTAINNVLGASTNVTANAVSGSAYVNISGAANVNLRNDPVTGLTLGATNNFNIISAQSLTTSNPLTALKNVSLTSTNGAVFLNGITSTGTVATNGGTFSVSAGTTIQTSTTAVIDTTSAAGAGGAISLISGTSPFGGNVDTVNLSLTSGSAATGGVGGNITLQSTAGTINNGSLRIAAVTTTGGNNAANGGAGFKAGNLSMTGVAITSGALTLSGGSNSFGSTGTANGGAGGAGGTLSITATGTSSIGAITAGGGTGENTTFATGTGGAGGQGGNITVNASNGFLTLGAISTVGGSSGSSSTTAGTVGGAAGTVTVSAGGATTITSITATGGVGGNSTLNAAGIQGGTGGVGGAINVSDSTGNLSIGLISANGGVGGTSNQPGATRVGGTGGAAGSVAVTSTTGALTLSSTVSAVGGTGGADTNAGSGTGGAGGVGGQISIQSLATTLAITGAVDASGGVAGAGVSAAGTRGQPKGNGVTKNSIQLFSLGAMTLSGSIAASAGASANTALITAANADIVITGKSVVMTGTYGATGANVFGGSNINVYAPGTVGIATYTTTGDLTGSSAVPDPTYTSSGFVVGTAAPTNGSTGRLATESSGTVGTGGIRINVPTSAASQGNPITTGTFSGGVLTIAEGGTYKTLFSGTNYTASEWIAATQIASTGAQTLSVNSSGVAIGGSFTLSDPNYNLVPPVGPGTTTFISLNIPANVTANITTTNNVVATGNIVIDGTVNFSTNSSGVLTSTTGNISGAGNIIANNASSQVLTLSAGGATGIGTAVANLNTKASIISATASNATGAVYITDSNATGIQLGTATLTNSAGSSNTQGIFSLIETTSSAPITIANNITAGAQVNITAGSGTSVFLNTGATVQATGAGGTVTIQSPGSLSVLGPTNGNASFTASNGSAAYVWIEANTGGAANSTLSVGGNLTFNVGPGAVFMTDYGTNTSFTLRTNASVTVSGAGGAGGITDHPYTFSTYPYLNISAPTINLGANSTIAATGNAYITIDSGCTTCDSNIVAPSGSAATLSTQNGMPIYVAGQTDSASITYGQSSSGGATLNVNGTFYSFTNCATCTQTVSPGVTIKSNNSIQFAANGGSTFTDNGTVQNTNAVGQTIISGYIGDLTINGTGTVISPNIVLSNIYGNINGTLGSATGTVQIAAGPYSVNFGTTSGGLTVGGNINTSAGDVTFTSGSGALTVKTGTQILANEGNVNLINLDTAAGTIVLGDIPGSATKTLIEGFTVSANPAVGNTNIYIGANTQTNQFNGANNPPNVAVTQQGAGAVYWGTNNITAVGPVNSVQALNRVATFSTGARPAGAILINGSVTIKADPPSADPVIVTPAPPSNTDMLAAMANPALTPLWSAPPQAPSSSSSSSNSSVVAFAPPAARSEISGVISPVTTPIESVTLPSTQTASVTPLDLLGGIEYIENLEHAGKKNRSSNHNGPNSGNGNATGSNATSNSGNGGWSHSPLKTMNFDGCDAKFLGTLDMVQNASGTITFNSGEALITAQAPTIIEISNQKVTIARGSTILIEKHGSVSVIRNVYDFSRDAVHVIFDKNSLAIAVGEEAVITPTEVSFSKTMEDGIGRRGIQTASMPAGQTLTKSEISLVSLLEHNEILGILLRSADKEDQAFASKLKKITACLMMATPNHGAYKNSSLQP